MHFVLGDITKMDTDAIVNAAASDLKPCDLSCDFSCGGDQKTDGGLWENRPREDR